MRSIALKIFDREQREQALQQCAALALPETALDDEADYNFFLCYQQGDWQLRQSLKHIQQHEALGTLHLSFASGAQRHRLYYGGGKNQLIGKALGLKQKLSLRILDATAGLGRDAFVMASLGCKVTACERHPLVFFLLQVALEKACNTADERVAEVAGRIEATHCDASELLHLSQDTQTGWDVIYCDPMFPSRKKTAKVKKDMQYLQYLCDSDALNKKTDEKALLDAALHSGCKRVVVKRPVHAPALEHERAPDYALSSKTTRYDIYALKALSGGGA